MYIPIAVADVAVAGCEYYTYQCTPRQGYLSTAAGMYLWIALFRVEPMVSSSPSIHFCFFSVLLGVTLNILDNNEDYICLLSIITSFLELPNCFDEEL